MTNIKPIKTKNDYNKALNIIEKLWDAKPGTNKRDELDILTTLVEKYEENNFKILPPDPVKAIEFRLEQMGMTQKDLSQMIGANRASEILKKKRRLTLNMIRLLHANLKIPIDSLIR